MWLALPVGYKEGTTTRLTSPSSTTSLSLALNIKYDFHLIVTGIKLILRIVDSIMTKGYSYNSHGTNSQGNHYCSRDYGSSAPNQNSYHYRQVHSLITATSG
ncbi:unnamed protein product [Rhizoctonia solani]|uniref:Uncharacterized protein n=1 Tax=Rhizoctonia solani TaxID=456999 RepID=A0A8H3I224_9AGAM|nr:unnamed protein product [Rhizoctonia solani]